MGEALLTFPSEESVLLVERHAQVVSDLPRLSKFQWVSFSHSEWYLEKEENSSFENYKTEEAQWDSYDFNLVFEDFNDYLKVKTQMKKLAGTRAHGWSTCLACVQIWLCSTALKKESVLLEGGDSWYL